jgi:ubiquinone/menaquinone biosynthesis C-methylase UbiE
MKPNFIKRFFIKTFAKQLRKPSGLLANKVGNKMNNMNGFLCDFTIETLNLHDDNSILEIGFGNGKLFEKLFSKANNLKISGLDFSSNMVKVAKANNPSTIASGNLDLRFGSSDKIPFADNSFDKVFCINVIYFWEQPADHLKEIYRVLKPGGKFYTSIRTKESMLQMPFVNYSLTIYSEDEWRNILEANRFHFMVTEKASEPQTELNGQYYKLESLCIVAEKIV